MHKFCGWFWDGKKSEATIICCSVVECICFRKLCFVVLLMPHRSIAVSIACRRFVVYWIFPLPGSLITRCTKLKGAKVLRVFSFVCSCLEELRKHSGVAGEFKRKRDWIVQLLCNYARKVLKIKIGLHNALATHNGQSINGCNSSLNMHFRFEILIILRTYINFMCKFYSKLISKQLKNLRFLLFRKVGSRNENRTYFNDTFFLTHIKCQ